MSSVGPYPKMSSTPMKLCAGDEPPPNRPYSHRHTDTGRESETTGEEGSVKQVGSVIKGRARVWADLDGCEGEVSSLLGGRGQRIGYTQHITTTEKVSVKRPTQCLVWGPFITIRTDQVTHLSFCIRQIALPEMVVYLRSAPLVREWWC